MTIVTVTRDVDSALKYATKILRINKNYDNRYRYEDSGCAAHFRAYRVPCHLRYKNMQKLRRCDDRLGNRW